MYQILMSCNKMLINYLKIIQCDFLDFCFRFHLSQLNCTHDKNDRPLHALEVGKSAKSVVYQILVLPTVCIYCTLSTASRLCRSVSSLIHIFLCTYSSSLYTCVWGSCCEIVRFDYLLVITALSEIKAQAFRYTRINIC
jgi:hypothetical protein